MIFKIVYLIGCRFYGDNWAYYSVFSASRWFNNSRHNGPYNFYYPPSVPQSITKTACFSFRDPDFVPIGHDIIDSYKIIEFKVR